MCKCKLFGAILLLVLAILFLQRDLGGWAFWNIQGWTVLFFLLALKFFHKSCCKCPDCNCCANDKKGKK
jgi:hypothetical protein